MKRTIKDFVLLLLRGIGMGAADIVPGVSGGTIAFITGIYKELIDSIKSVNIEAFKLLISFKIAKFWKHVNGNFLVSIFLGIFISIFSLSKYVLKPLLETHPILVWSFFFGLIVASAIYIIKKIERWNYKNVIAIIIGVAVAYLLTIVSPAKTPDGYWFVFIAGVISICAMILPGISGAFILLLLGKYEYIFIDAVSNFKIDILIVYATGAVIGLISFSNLLSWILKKYYNITIAILAGFMIGSLNKLWPWKEVIKTYLNSHGVAKPLVEKSILPSTYSELAADSLSGTSNNPYLIQAIIFALIGFVLIFAIEFVAKKLQKKDS